MRRKIHITFSVSAYFLTISGKSFFIVWHFDIRKFWNFDLEALPGMLLRRSITLMKRSTSVTLTKCSLHYTSLGIYISLILNKFLRQELFLRKHCLIMKATLGLKIGWYLI